MPLYQLRCRGCGAIGDLRYPSNVPVHVACEACGCSAERYFTPDTVPQFQEDRLRFFRLGREGPSDRHSFALGQDMPDSRAELRRLEREKQIEFISPREMPEQWKQLREHTKHVKEGGTPLAPDALNPRPTGIEPGTIMAKVREKGISLRP